jgi:ribonucleotide reductase beta subunit family protein with ferritin-like domain
MSVAQKDGSEQRSQTSQISYADLYERWEEGNWKATEIDFSADREGWRSLSSIQRASAMWIFSMFFYGEDRVADDLSPYIAAAPTEEQKYFLATQQVDEARHSVFFHRFFREVIGVDGTSIGETLAATAPELNWGYRGIFDRLDRMASELAGDRSKPKFAQAITLYHMVVEATLAQPGQHFIEDYVAKTDILPGFAQGMHNVSRDEQRHIGFGVKTLSELFAESDECRAAAAELLQEVLPYSLAVFTPPGWDLRYTREWGFELEDIFAFGIRSVRAKWKATGYPLEEMPPGVFPVDPAIDPAEIARRQITLLRAGVMGAPNGSVQSSAEIQEIYFDIVARSANSDAAEGRPFTVQWRFEDAEPWHVVVDNGSTRAEAGEATSADVTVESTWGDWVDFSVRGMEPWRKLLTRRIKPHGSPRDLVRMARVFPRRRGLARS